MEFYCRILRKSICKPLKIHILIEFIKTAKLYYQEHLWNANTILIFKVLYSYISRESSISVLIFFLILEFYIVTLQSNEDKFKNNILQGRTVFVMFRSRFFFPTFKSFSVNTGFNKSSSCGKAHIKYMVQYMHIKN